MKQFFSNPITITVGIILTLGILALIGYNYWGWFGGKSSKNGINIPNSFLMPRCGGVPNIWTMKYYKENNKYYNIQVCTSDNPNMCESLVAPTPNEISEQDYYIAYKQSKQPCDPLQPRMSQSVNENNSVEKDASSQANENVRMANKETQCWQTSYYKDLAPPHTKYLLQLFSLNCSDPIIAQAIQFIQQQMHHIIQSQSSAKSKMSQLQSDFQKNYPSLTLKTTINPILPH